MKYLKNFIKFEESLAVTDSSIPKAERTKPLTEDEFLEILNENCKNFSFDNDLLWRNKVKKTDIELFNPSPRNASPLAFPKFFNKIEKDPDYPVVRKNSLIGGTNKDILDRLVGLDNYLVIPFDNSDIVFCPVVDLWAMDDSRMEKSEKVNKEPVDKKHFVKVSYTKDFRIPSDELELRRSRYNLRGGPEHGYEFFTSSPCLLVHNSKVDWLRSVIK